MYTVYCIREQKSSQDRVLWKFFLLFPTERKRILAVTSSDQVKGFCRNKFKYLGAIVSMLLVAT